MKVSDRNKIWMIIAAVATVASVIAVVTIYLLTKSYEEGCRQEEIRRQKRALSVHQLLPTIIQIPPDRPTGQGLSISFNGQVIDKYVMIRAQVVNEGSQPIRSLEFEVPIRLHLEQFKKVVTAAIAGASPPDLGVTVKTGPNFVELSRVLLNPSDTYIVEVGVIARRDQTPKISRVSGRVVGVKEIEYDKSPYTFELINLIGDFAAASKVGPSRLKLMKRVSISRWLESVHQLLLFLIGALAGAIVVLAYWRLTGKKKRRRH